MSDCQTCLNEETPVIGVFLCLFASLKKVNFVVFNGF